MALFPAKFSVWHQYCSEICYSRVYRGVSEDTPTAQEYNTIFPSSEIEETTVGGLDVDTPIDMDMANDTIPVVRNVVRILITRTKYAETE
jgi:hypothetical protein